MTEEEAIRHVQGKAKHALMIGSATITGQVLRETVGVRAEDIIFEIGCGVGRVAQVLAPIGKALDRL